MLPLDIESEKVRQQIFTGDAKELRIKHATYQREARKKKQLKINIFRICNSIVNTVVASIQL